MKAIFDVLTDVFEILTLGTFVAAIALVTPGRADDLDPSNPVWDWGWLPLLVVGAYICIRLIYPRKSKVQISEPFADDSDWGRH